MRVAVLLGLIFLLATAAVVGQTTTGISLVDVRFTGETRLQTVYLRQCTDELKSRTYDGSEWQDYVTERARSLCFQNNGYFKAVVRLTTIQLPEKHATHQFVITFDVDAGPQYRTGQLNFANNRLFSAEELRSMFGLTSGDTFSPAKLRQGLLRMSNAYIERGYLNFTPVPATIIDDSRHIISLVIDCDEGQQIP
jgi:outer membrane protein assembly factor BamA